MSTQTLRGDGPGKGPLPHDNGAPRTDPGPPADFRSPINRCGVELRANWAQFMTGVDLAKAAMRDEPDLISATIAVADSGFSLPDLTGQLSPELTRQRETWLREPPAPGKGINHDDHGTSVVNLINGAEVGYAARARIQALVPTMTSQGRNLNGALDQLIASRAHLANLSQRLGADEATRERLNRLSQSTLIVVAAGNFQDRAQDLNNTTVNGIVVGSLHPTGLPSRYTRPGQGTTILAPSDEWVYTRGLRGELDRFGGTSGAAPQVTGALANVISILGPLTPGAARTLLQRTAIPTLNTDVNPGSGTLNAYRLVEVAKRLKRRGWPAGASVLLADASLFDFSRESREALDRARALLERGQCAQQESALSEVRRAFLLDPRNANARRLLTTLLDREGYRTLGDFLRLLDPIERRDVFERALRSDDPGTQGAMARALLFYGEDAVAVVRGALLGPDVSLARRAVQSLWDYFPDGLPLLGVASHHRDAEVRQRAASLAHRFGTAARPILERLAADTDERVRRIASSSLRQLADLPKQ